MIQRNLHADLKASDVNLRRFSPSGLGNLTNIGGGRSQMIGWGVEISWVFMSKKGYLIGWET